MSLLSLLKNKGVNRRVIRKSFMHKLISKDWFMRPYFNKTQRDKIVHNGDPVRYGTMLLALEQIDKAKIVGAMAECGVWKGYLSKFIRTLSKERNYYLFDTFSGFDSKDKDNFSEEDKRFKDTSAEGVLKYIETEQNIIIKKGYFPQTTLGLEKEQFAFVVIDFDKYEPTKAALEFFYPRLSKGGYVFIHDYNSPESNWACYRAVNEFLTDKVEIAISIPDAWGSCLFVKV
jgi:O-methyltransferase